MVVRKYWKRKRGAEAKVRVNAMEKEMGVWSPEVKEDPRGSTNPGLVGSPVGTGRKAKWFSTGKLEDTARKVADA
jgi:hypothetical protein